MKDKKTKSILEKLSSKTFEEVKNKQVFDPAMIFGATLGEDVGVLLTANKDATKYVLQIGKNKMFLNEDSLNFLIKSLVTLGGMVGTEGANAFRAKITASQKNNSEDDDIKFVRVLSKLSGNKELLENVDLITSSTDKMVVENTLGAILFFTDKNIGDSEKKRVILRTTGISDKLFERIEDDFIELKKSGVEVPDSDFLKVSEAIAFNLDCIEKVKGTISTEEMDVMIEKLIKSFVEITNTHRNYYKDMPQEDQSVVLKRLIDSIKDIKEDDKTDKQKTKSEIQADTDKMLDDILDAIKKPENNSAKIEEGVMEDVSSEEVIAESIPDNLAEHPKTPEESFSLFQDQSEDAWDELLKNTGGGTQSSMNGGSLSQRLDEEEEEELPDPAQQAFFEDEDEDRTLIDYSLINDEFEEDSLDEFELESQEIESIEDELEYDEGKATTGGPVLDDEDEELEDEEEGEEVDDDFLKRMEDVESMLTGNFEKLEEEIPTFEKIEKLKMEHGELAAKEYVSSLSQEQREFLVKERLAARVAAQESKTTTEQE